MRVVELAGTGGPDVLVPATRPVPHPAADQLLVRVRACGVCGHDLLARRGVLAATAGSVIGHEIAGEVVAVGSGVRDPGAWSGRRVALVQRIPCGACPDCTAGSTTHCRLGPGFYGEDLPGGYAEYVVASPLNAVPIPDDVDDATGSILSCGVGTGLRALRRAGTGPGDVVVVTGAGGGLGVHAVALARHLGATVVALTGSPAKEEPLLRLGAAAVLIAPDAARVRRRVAELGGRRGADVVLELTGAPAFAVALRSLAPGGRLVLVGNTEPALLPLDPGLAIVKELCVYGSAHADRSDLGDVVDLVRSGAITPMAARTWPLHEAALAHDAVERRQVAGRAVLVP
ncbi:alcohol dehydrogenase catalytic domain-containing protein [Pseudonocardia adelaidensis]